MAINQSNETGNEGDNIPRGDKEKNIVELKIILKNENGPNESDNAREMNKVDVNNTLAGMRCVRTDGRLYERMDVCTNGTGNHKYLLFSRVLRRSVGRSVRSHFTFFSHIFEHSEHSYRQTG